MLGKLPLSPLPGAGLGSGVRSLNPASNVDGWSRPRCGADSDTHDDESMNYGDSTCPSPLCDRSHGLPVSTEPAMQKHARGDHAAQILPSSSSLSCPHLTQHSRNAYYRLCRTKLWLKDRYILSWGQRGIAPWHRQTSRGPPEIRGLENMGGSCERLRSQLPYPGRRGLGTPKEPNDVRWAGPAPLRHRIRQ